MSRTDSYKQSTELGEVGETSLDRYDNMSDKIRQAEVLAKFLQYSEVFAELNDDLMDYLSALSSILTTVRSLNEKLHADLEGQLASKFVLSAQSYNKFKKD